MKRWRPDPGATAKRQVRRGCFEIAVIVAFMIAMYVLGILTAIGVWP